MARTRAGDQGSWTLLIFSGLGVNRGIDPKGIFRVQKIGDLFLPALSRKLPLVYQAIINGARPDLLRRAPGKGVGRGGRALALELASLRLRARGQSFLRRRASERRQRPLQGLVRPVRGARVSLSKMRTLIQRLVMFAVQEQRFADAVPRRCVRSCFPGVASQGARERGRSPLRAAARRNHPGAGGV